MEEPNVENIVLSLEINENERKLIFDVIERNRKLLQNHQSNIKPLETNMKNIEFNSLDIPSSNIKTANLCVRCKSKFNSIFNKAESCVHCNYRVCQNCRIYIDLNRQSLKPVEQKWLCKYCYTFREYIKYTGEWKELFAYKYNRNKKNSNFSLNSETLKIKNRNTSSNQLASNVLQNKSFGVEDKPVEKENTNTSKKIEFIITEPDTSTNSVETEPKFESTSNLLMKMSPSFDENYLFNDTLSEKNITIDLSSAYLSQTTEEEHSKDKNEAFKNYTNSRLSESKIDATASQVSAPGTTATGDVENKKENKNSKWKNVFNRVNSIKTAKQRAKSETEKYVQMDDINMDHDFQKPVTKSDKNSFRKLAHSTPITIQKKSLAKLHSSNKLDDSIISSFKKSPTLSGNVLKSNELALSSSVENRNKKSPSNQDLNIVPKSPLSLKLKLNKSINSMFNRGLSVDEKITGKIFLRLDFKQTTSNLNVFVASCENLEIGNPKKNKTNPYVKLKLITNENQTNKLKTTTKRNTQSPVYNENLRIGFTIYFKYTISGSKLNSSVLNVSVWHNGKSNKKFLGEVILQLSAEELKNFDAKENKEFQLVSHVHRL